MLTRRLFAIANLVVSAYVTGVDVVFHAAVRGRETRGWRVQSASNCVCIYGFILIRRVALCLTFLRPSQQPLSHAAHVYRHNSHQSDEQTDGIKMID